MQVIDSSAIVSFFAKEPGWERVAEYVANSFTIPLALVELGSAFEDKISEGEIRIEAAAGLLAEYSAKVMLLDQNKHLTSALAIAATNRATMYDSLFIAVAVGESCNLVSCDKKQAKIARKLGVKVIEC